MDHRQISEFVNSKDVRKYLQDIGYEFSTPQAAWLVHRCQRLTMEDRHRAWREIIRDMPDCTMAERRNLKQIDSFHAFLMDYIKLEKRSVQEFMTAGNYIYRWQYHEIHIEDARYYKYWVLQKKLCKSRQAIVKGTGANQGLARTGQSPA